jgi:hypothetical protein
MDTTQFFSYFIVVVLEKNKCNEYHDSHRVSYNVVLIFCLCLTVMKILSFIRFDDEYGFLVQMILSVFVDLIPFLTIFLMFNLLFVLVSLIMEVNQANSDYDGVNYYLQAMIGEFRMSIGDINLNGVGPWKQDEVQNDMAVFVIWAFRLANIFIMMIILLNFLIAEVSQTYDKVKSAGQ